jgi:hypothetical protein|nr:MAG TPA: helix-turn-helix domain protein [Caudoviricetes sp.]
MNEVKWMRLGDNLKTIRTKKKISQKDLACAVGVHASLICKIETGASQCSLKTLKKIADTLKVKIDTLTKEIENEAC